MRAVPAVPEDPATAPLADEPSDVDGTAVVLVAGAPDVDVLVVGGTVVVLVVIVLVVGGTVVVLVVGVLVVGAGTGVAGAGAAGTGAVIVRATTRDPECS